MHPHTSSGVGWRAGTSNFGGSGTTGMSTSLLVLSLLPLLLLVAP